MHDRVGGLKMSNGDLREGFINPDDSFRPVPKWVWNAQLEDITADALDIQMRSFKERDGYGGLMIVLWGYPGYGSDEFFSKYGAALKAAEKYGLTVTIWDEDGFPSGFAGGQIGEKYPEYAARRIDMTEWDVAGGETLDQALPAGILIGAVIMNDDTKERTDISDRITADNRLKWTAPAGKWKVMAFTCAIKESYQTIRNSWPLVNYLDSEAISKFIELTHQRYFDRFERYFGSTIKFAFYDEPSFWHVDGGRIWTENFNHLFRERRGYDPMTLYPALWHDIGEETAYARNELFGFRAELYATEYIRTMADWCASHSIKLTGHMDQEEIANPTSISGDLMKTFEYQDMPGVDEISFYGRGSKAYKIISSAANNYDKPYVMCEVFGAMGEEMPVDILWKESMDLFAKGVNYMVPHGTWFDSSKNVTFPPELSFRNAKFGPAMPKYNLYCARGSHMLQGGRHIADTGIIYPINSLQAAYRFGDENPYLGGIIPPETDYLLIGELLSLELNRDFTYLHPEALDGKCMVQGNTFVLENEINFEEYRVIIIPGMKTMNLSNLKKIRTFVENGGCVITTTVLPEKSSEKCRDAEIRSIVKAILSYRPGVVESVGTKGGKTVFLPSPDAESLKAALDEMIPTPDVKIERSAKPTGGNISYIHKYKDGHDIYFFANSGDNQVMLDITLRGMKSPAEIWDPDTGGMMELEFISADERASRFKLDLPAVSSRFVVAES